MKKTLLTAACVAAFIASGACAAETTKAPKQDIHAKATVAATAAGKNTADKKDAKVTVNTAANKTDKDKTVKKN
ncbi:MAG TPA: hypothetical protein VFT64_12005 [Rickettsiales bacterium]|nr:hypothetical protein [Rickettsiales bacterium]